jgi:hypothetical protein
MAKQHHTHDPFEEVKFVSLFSSPKLAYEIERTPSPSLEPKPCPSGNPNKNSYAMDSLEAPTLESERRNSINEHESFTFETPRISCSLSKSPEFVSCSAQCFYEDCNHLLILVSKLFKRLVWGYRPIYPNGCSWATKEEVAQLARTSHVDHLTDRCAVWDIQCST